MKIGTLHDLVLVSALFLGLAFHPYMLLSGVEIQFFVGGLKHGERCVE